VKLGRVYCRVFMYTSGKQRGQQVGLFRKLWRRACRAAGKPGTIVHGLRRSGIRNMVRNGVSETVAMKVSGHRTASMFRRYNITPDDDLRAVAERMGMSSGITESGAAKTRLVSMRSSWRFSLRAALGAVYARPMLRRAVSVLLASIAITACATPSLSFPNATPGKPLAVPAWELRPAGPGPFPAVVLLHGCAGISDSNHEWSRWFRDQGYVALLVDSWTPRRVGKTCDPSLPDIPNTERFDDTIGALHYLQTRPYVDPARVGVVGWSNGGVFAIAVINGPSLERARRRGVVLPEPGFRASIGFYPGGCYSLVQEQVTRPLLVMIGDADDWTVPGPCVEMVEAMRRRGADASLVLYPQAYHYFDVTGQPRTYLAEVSNHNKPNECCGATVAFDPGAFADSRRRVAEFFGYHLKGK
jgi:dienelactone hydrolase